jgi:hypothetical protein
MSMKKADFDKSAMLSAAGQMKFEGRTDKFGKGISISNRKDQRKLDQAAGLVPFACKLPIEMVKMLGDEAIAKNLGMNELVATLLKKGIAGQTE